MKKILALFLFAYFVLTGLVMAADYALTDPNVDSWPYWDDSAGAMVWLTFDIDDFEFNGTTFRLVAEIPHLDVAETLSGDWVNTANPWADNEVADDITLTNITQITNRKLDDLGAPDDNSDLNATTSAHGLLPKLDNVATNFLNGQGGWSVPTAAAAGSDTQVQFNDGGTALGGDAGMTYDKASDTLKVGSVVTVAQAAPEVIFNDSDAAGADAADKEAAKILGNMETTTEDSEDGKMSLQVMRDGSEVTGIDLDGNTNIITSGDATFQNRVLGKTAGANDGVYDGLVRTYTVDSGATSTFGQALHVDTDGELIVADGDVASAGAMPAIGLAVEAGTGAKKVLLNGLICETDWDWTVGGIVYVSDDPGTTQGLTQTAISTTGDTVQVVGIAVTGDCIEVNMGGYVLVEVP